MVKISLKAARVNAGFHQEDVAARLCINPGTVSAWETGKKAIHPVFFDALCRLYGMKPDEIFLPSELRKTKLRERK